MKNLNNLKNGYIFAPYILIPTVNIITGSTAPNINVKSRYSTKIINSGLYGMIGVDNFNFKDEQKMIERRKKLDKIINNINNKINKYE